MLYLVYLRRAILATVLEGRPFAAANVGRIRIIGSVLIALGFLVPIIEYFVTRVVLAQISLQGIAVQAPFDIRHDTALAGLLVFVLAKTFGYGSHLEADKSLTI